MFILNGLCKCLTSIVYGNDQSDRELSNEEM